jgi:hypothetical protein
METRPPRGSDRLSRKATIDAIRRAVRGYWEHEKAQPIPDHLIELAAKADEALAKRSLGVYDSSDTSSPENSGERSRDIT